MDRFSKLVRAIPICNVRASTVAEVYVNEWVAVYGPPIIILSDNGAQFRSRFMQCVNSILGVRHCFTTAYRPSTNGQCERFKKDLGKQIAHFAASQDEWDHEVACATYAYNRTVHSTTGFAHFEMVLSRAPTALDIASEDAEFGTVPRFPAEYRHEFLSRVEKMGRACRETMKVRQERYKRMYDAYVRARNSDIEIGDLVAVRTFVTEPGRSPKIEFPVTGPYVVVEKTPTNFVIRTREGRQSIHSARVIKFPRPTELPAGVEGVKVERADESPPETFDEEEYVVEQIVDHGVAGDGTLLVKVR